jgi:hypothetical protein
MSGALIALLGFSAGVLPLVTSRRCAFVTGGFAGYSAGADCVLCRLRLLGTRHSRILVHFDEGKWAELDSYKCLDPTVHVTHWPHIPNPYVPAAGLSLEELRRFKKRAGPMVCRSLRRAPHGIRAEERPRDLPDAQRAASRWHQDPALPGAPSAMVALALGTTTTAGSHAQSLTAVPPSSARAPPALLPPAFPHAHSALRPRPHPSLTPFR